MYYMMCSCFVDCVVPSILVIGPVEADPEYEVIVDSNNMVVEIDNEISKGIAFSQKSCHGSCDTYKLMS